MLYFRKRNILILVLILMLQSLELIYSQPDTARPFQRELEQDHSFQKVETVPHQKIEDFRKDNAFKYDMTTLTGFDFWSVFWYWVDKILEKIFSNEGAAPYIRYFVMFLVLALVVYKIFGGNFSRIFSYNKKFKAKNGFEYADEDIHQQDLEDKLNNAIINKNYREAIRYYYLKLLKELDIHNLIKWEPGKTNRDYKKELNKNPLFDNFNSLSGIYEYSWYGNFMVNEAMFENWQVRFSDVIGNIQNN